MMLLVLSLSKLLLQHLLRCIFYIRCHRTIYYFNYSRHINSAIFGFMIVRLRVYLSMHKGLKDGNTMIFIQLLTPFVVYFISEMLHASGLLQL